MNDDVERKCKSRENLNLVGNGTSRPPKLHHERNFGTDGLGNTSENERQHLQAMRTTNSATQPSIDDFKSPDDLDRVKKRKAKHKKHHTLRKIVG